ncbi:hypothetical protein Tco_0313861 [Tanacetum coccineum]
MRLSISWKQIDFMAITQDNKSNAGYGKQIHEYKDFHYNGKRITQRLSNGEVQIQALVDGKKVIVTETSVRRALQLKDAEGTECLPNATIFAELERMSAMTTAWNKISSTMASAIIVFDEQEVEVEKVVSTAEVTTTSATTTIVDELTLAQTLIEIKAAKPKADYELAQRLQAEEHGELTIEERSKLFVELMDKRKKHFTKLRHSQLKNKSFEEIQMLFDNTMKWVDSFVPMDTEVMEGSKSQCEGIKENRENLSLIFKEEKDRRESTSHQVHINVDKKSQKRRWDTFKASGAEGSSKRSFMVEGVNGEFHFLPEGGANDEGSSPSTKFVNNEALVIDVEPLTAVHPSEFAENISDSDNAPSKECIKLLFVGRFVNGKAQHQKRKNLDKIAQKVPPQASKASSDASNPLDVDSDPDIHEFPSAKEIKDYADCRLGAVLDNMLNSRTRNLMSTLSKARASCDAIRERKGKVDKLHGMYRRLVLEEKKLITYKQILSILCSKVKGLESERERLKSSETQLLQEIDRLRQDKAVVVSKVVPHMAMKLFCSDEMGLLEMDIQKRMKNKAKNDKTEHGMEKCEKTKPNQSQKVNQVKKSTEQSKLKSIPTKSVSTPRN